MYILKQKLSLVIVSVLLFLVSCKKDDVLKNNKISVTINTTLPSGISAVNAGEMKISLKEINTGAVTNAVIVNNSVVLGLAAGVYDITIEADATYTENGKANTGKLRGYLEALRVVNTPLTQDIALFSYAGSDGFVFQEIFFAGTLTPEGAQYLGDRYFRIYNNSDDTLYADGLVIGDTEFLTTAKEDYQPNIMSSAVAVGSLIRIPGSGTDYPVYPGKGIIIAETGINHLEYNANSFDLSKADFEIYNEDMDDVDNPNVKNTEAFYNEMIIHNRGFKSFVLARIPVTSEKFFADNKYDYLYKFVFGEYSFDMDGSTYKIPNEWVIDAVNLSVESEFQWIVTDPSLDMGWTYSGKVDADRNRYGNSVQRKQKATGLNGRVILQDTNNSTEDFTPQTKASLSK